jgi:RNA polymerase sigma factor (sigma-70 family)
MRHSNDPDQREFTRFVKETEPRLSYALAAAYGMETGTEATADALGWAWEHWDRVKTMTNPGGYLYRVGQSNATRYIRPRVLFPQVAPMDEQTVVPELPGALDELSKNQRVAVVMIHGFGYTEREVADLVGISRWSVRTHAERGLNKLRSTLGVTIDV